MWRKVNSLYEYSDRLNSPYECFLFDTQLYAFPVRPHWHYFMEILFMLEGTAMINCDQNTYVLEPGDIILFLPQQIHSIYSTTNIPLKYYVLKFDINQLSPSANASGSTFSGIHFPSLFRSARGNESASLYLPTETLEGLPIEQLFSDCQKEMDGQEYGYRILMQSCTTHCSRMSCEFGAQMALTRIKPSPCPRKRIPFSRLQSISTPMLTKHWRWRNWQRFAIWATPILPRASGNCMDNPARNILNLSAWQKQRTCCSLQIWI